MRSRNHQAGFSLLEVIVVLAIIGGALAMYTNYARKQAAKEMRQTIANALVQEMKGVMNYLRDETLQTKDGEKDNPLYEATQGSSTDSQYRYRITNNVTDIDTGTGTNYFLWGEGANQQKQQRYLFISKSCNVSLKSTFELTQEYLPCSLVTAAKNPAAKIERIGFASDDLKTPSSTIARMDAIVAFNYTESNDKYSFANYASAFNNALSNSGLIASHIMLVRRVRTADAWQLITKSDGSTPVEFSDMASNLERLETQGKGQQLGIRITFDMNDNDQGSNGGGSGTACWNTQTSKVELCYNQEAGTGAHGEDQILSLDMTDPENYGDETKTGTLKANLVMENTSRPVFLFKRNYGGDLMLFADGSPERFTYKNNNNEEIEGDFYLDDNTSYRPWDGSSMAGFDVISNYYPSSAYDAFELVTPSVSEYSGYELLSADITDKKDYVAAYDDSSINSGLHRFAVQTCPVIEQEIILRDANGDAILDEDGNKEKTKVTRALYPRLSASISSVSAYNDGGISGSYVKQNETRAKLDDSKKVDLLGGVTVQVELAEMDVSSGVRPDHNSAQKYKFPGSKYVWAVTATMGLYDSETGAGFSIVNPQTISYVITKWCSTIPQSGTPYDLLTTTEYK
ncbi:type II secretion system GspH family protein [Citrobacter cronae]|uniref:prepilin-type N-terminal cleavage/methylation domain-containing protein n=1 Tax=Citrobacter cronae TaxID=1748967 RepID=UPI0021D03C93|nr:type II secretion system protein [Citrobacter cronae]MCU6183301.1 type II secretion system GspH family protein [Citrobacter cronae]